ncbi:MAG: hypothetical protein V3W14_01370, partial [Candidatus Neomarinimicrobiota bacterium]
VRQQELIAEIRALHNDQSWYNGWIIEWQIARRSRLQVQLADSVQLVRGRISALAERRDKTFSNLKQIYRQLLLPTSQGVELTLAEKKQAITIGRQFIGRTGPQAELPDYASILASPFEDPAVRRLVIQDLQSVLQVKLGLIDSLIAERATELALLERLDEFHRDLDYQLLSEIDPEADAELSGNQQATEPDEERGFFDLSTGAVTEDGKRYAVTSPGQTPLVTGEIEIGLDGEPLASSVRPMDATLQQLKSKRQQYQDLLHRIKGEQQH